MVKSMPAMRETWVQSLGQEDPLEKEMLALEADGRAAWECSAMLTCIAIGPVV